MTTLLFTTNPGLEDLVADELEDLAGSQGVAIDGLEIRPAGVSGRITTQIDGPWELVLSLAYRLRSIHHIMRPIDHFVLPEQAPLQAIQERLSHVPIPELVRASTFRVTSERMGEHPFTSPEVERTVGAVLVARYGLGVDLEGFEVNLRVDIIGETCMIAVQLTQTALSHRYQRVYQPRVTLKPNVAYAALRLAQLPRQPRSLLDPFCGSGTILLEAAHLFPQATLLGSDWDHRAVTGTHANAEAAQLAESIHLRTADARTVRQAFPEIEEVDAIVTNPPYGRQLGRRIKFVPFYAACLRELHTLLPHRGRLVIIIHKRGAFAQALRRVGRFRVRCAHVIETSGLFPTIFVLQRS